MATCTQCSVAMAVNERSQNKRGGAAVLHVDCAELEDQLYWATRWNDRGLMACIQQKINHLNAKKNNLATQWP